MSYDEDPRSFEELEGECRSCGCGLDEGEGQTVEVDTPNGDCEYPALCGVCADEFYLNQREHPSPNGGPA